MCKSAPCKRLYKTYGITAEDKAEMLRRQNNCCSCCGLPFGQKKTFIDHEHVKNYAKLPPQEKAKYVRGVLDYRCNFLFVGKHNVHSAKQVLEYLIRYHSRLN